MSLQAQPLVWGHGPRTFEVFLEPTCPFSVRAFNKLDELLDEVGADNVTIKIRLQSQPWHLFSGVIVRCILAASTLADGKAAAHKVMKAVADHREEFEFTDHCSGPNMQATPQEIIERLERYSGVPLAEAELKELASALKKRCGCGGGLKDGVIEIQGDMVDLLLEELAKRGFKAKKSGG
mgnify:CR=1 FL=1